jgi:hypothetical protein
MQDGRTAIFLCSIGIDKVEKFEVGKTGSQNVVLDESDEVVGG